MASVFVLVCGHFSALEVKFFDRFLTLACVFGVRNVCDIFGVSGGSGARSIIGVRHDVSRGCLWSLGSLLQVLPLRLFPFGS